jgi:hypothetical protein
LSSLQGQARWEVPEIGRTSIVGWFLKENSLKIHDFGYPYILMGAADVPEQW